MIGVKNYKTIGDALKELSIKVFGRKSHLAVTGMEGVGKTVLLHALTGESSRPSYTPPRRSQSVEHRKVIHAGKKLLVSTVPGQPAYTRYVALDDLFRGKKPVEGVIHVVSSGFASIRSPDAQRVLIQDEGLTTVTKFRQYQKRREWVDLEETLRAIRDSHRRHHAPKWLVIAVDKIDLYCEELEEQGRLYSPSSQSNFVKKMNELTHQVGQDNIRWAALPVCGRLEEFEWNGTGSRPDWMRQCGNATWASSSVRSPATANRQVRNARTEKRPTG